MSANRILVVEDDRAIASAVTLNLKCVGYEVKQFYDGGEAAVYLKDDHAFDLALLDIMLPGIDGFALLEYIQNYNITRNNTSKGYKQDLMLYYTWEKSRKHDIILKKPPSCAILLNGYLQPCIGGLNMIYNYNNLWKLLIDKR